MRAKLFVGNLPWSVSDLQLEELFQPHGDVESARVITDRDSGRSRGFGFVEIDAPDIQEVIRAVNGREIDGRAIRVNEAEEDSRGPRRDRRDSRDSGRGGQW
jgi:RNA recognition motif-containing protein